VYDGFSDHRHRTSSTGGFIKKECRICLQEFVVKNDVTSRRDFLAGKPASTNGGLGSPSEACDHARQVRGALWWILHSDRITVRRSKPDNLADERYSKYRL
jgi:hypothetical protein